MRKIILMFWILLLFGGLVPAEKVGAETPSYWEKRYSGGDDDSAYGVAITPDGDIIVVGYTYSFGAGASDVWVLSLDEYGNVKWQKTYGGSEKDEAYAVAVADNGDIIVAGWTESFGAGDRDFWILRLDENGDVKWQKTYCGSNSDIAEAVAITPDGDIIVVGYTYSFGAGASDVWVLSLDEYGNVKWQKTYGGSGDDEAYGVAIAPNGDIVVAGWTESFGAGDRDFWILRLDENGNVKWQKTYGGSGREGSNILGGDPVVTIADNGDIILAGPTTSFGAGDWNFWILRLDENGNVKWQKTYARNEWDVAHAVVITPNGDIIVAGGYLLRLAPGGELKWAVGKWGEDIKILPDGTAVLVGDDRVLRFNVDEVPDYSWEEVTLEVHDTNAEVSATNAVVGTSNAVVSDTNAQIQDMNAEVETLWTYTPSPIEVHGYEVIVREKVAEEQVEGSARNESALVTYRATTEVYRVTVKMDGEERPGYLVRHNVTIINVTGEVEAFRTVFNVSKEVAYSVDDMILPPDVIIINPEPVIALDIKDPKEGQSVNQTVGILSEVPESEFLQGVKIDHEVVTKSNSENSTCGPGAFLGLALISLMLRRRK